LGANKERLFSLNQNDPSAKILNQLDEDDLAIVVDAT
jgi:hypothetical protein